MATVGAFVDFGDFGAFVIFGDLELLKDRDWCAFRGRRETKRIGEIPERAHAGKSTAVCFDTTPPGQGARQPTTSMSIRVASGARSALPPHTFKRRSRNVSCPRMGSFARTLSTAASMGAVDRIATRATRREAARRRVILRDMQWLAVSRR